MDVSAEFRSWIGICISNAVPDPEDVKKAKIRGKQQRHKYAYKA
jgi:hypothetical protein